ncbi:MAG TPA: hypothetical protein VI932_06770 [Bacteroidota bacterium]|nr:hypothetical protein [Bacteroidota bacterium]
MKLHPLVGVLIFLTIVNIAAVDTYVYYQIVHGPRAMGDVFPSDPGAEGTGQGITAVSRLDSAQRKEIAKIKTMFKSNTGGIFERLKVLDDEIYDLIQRDPVPQDAIDERLRELSDLRLRRSRIAVNTLLETRSLLTREQRGELFKAIFRTRPRVSSTDPRR